MFLSLTQALRYHKFGISPTNGMIILPYILKVVEKWRKYVLLKKKLRAILSKKGK